MTPKRGLSTDLIVHSANLLPILQGPSRKCGAVRALNALDFCCIWAALGNHSRAFWVVKISTPSF
jgi:hypothetical protein